MAEVSIFEQEVYRKAWAETTVANAPPPKSTPKAMYLIPAVVWVTCILTFVTGFRPDLLPGWIANITLGLTILMFLMIVSLSVLLTLGVVVNIGRMIKLSVDVDMADDPESKERAKLSFAEKKLELAQKYLYKYGLKQQIRFGMVALQVGLLFAGQAYITGTSLFVLLVYIQVLMYFDRTAARTTADNIIKQDTLVWLDAPMLSPETAENAQRLHVITKFENGVQEAKALKPKT